ncbi:MAG: efflux RND transporter periplasmic adaptor subunit [Bacteroidales bacterium]
MDINKTYFRWIIPVFAVIILLGCNRTNERGVIPPPKIGVYTVSSKEIPIHRDFVGQVYGEKDIPVRARVEGILEGMHFEEGTEVKAGQLLYTIDPEPFQAKVNARLSELAEAQTMLVKAESDLKRIEPLAQRNAVSASDLDAARAQYDAAQVNVEAVKANLRSAEIEMGYCKIYSPINGIIGKTNARPGDFVGRDPNPIILNTISTIENIRVQFFITENDFLELSREFASRKQSGELNPDETREIRLILADGSVYKYPGHVDFMDRGIDPSTGSMLIQASFPNPDRILRPGMYARVRVTMQRVPDAIVIPQRAVTELQGQFSVFLVAPDSTVASHPITIRKPVGDLYWVTEGLSVGDIIVLDGIQKVRDGVIIIPEPVEFESQYIN